MNTANIKNAYKKVQALIERTWAKNAPQIARELIEASVQQEQRTSEHGNITGNMITSIVAMEYCSGQRIGYTYEGKPALRGMLTRGEVFDGMSWDGAVVKFRGTIDTSGEAAATENINALLAMQPRLPYSLILLRGTPYANEIERLQGAQLDNMTDLLVYAKGFIRLVKII